MPPDKPRVFYWFFGVWVIASAWSIASVWMPDGQIYPPSILVFWLVAIASLLIGRWAFRQLWRWRLNPPVFDPADGSTPRKLRSTRLSMVTAMIAFLCCAGFALTLGALPFSKTAQLLSGWRGRNIEIRSSPIAAEDEQLCMIGLLPVGKFPREIAATLAANLRRETGLNIGALPQIELPGIEFNESRHQVTFESIGQPLFEAGKKMRVPPQPHPHRLMLVALIQDDMYSTHSDWRFLLSAAYSGTNFAVVSIGHLNLGLPLDDEAASKLIETRATKLVLRLIALEVIHKERDEDRRSLTGPTFRGLDDLDFCEEHLRFKLGDLIKPVSGAERK